MDRMDKTAAPAAEAVSRLLLDLAERFGTPTYAYDVARMHRQVGGLRAALPPAVDLLYSLKANPSLGLCSLFASWGLGADVASAGELLTALESGIAPEHIFVSGPYKSPELLGLLPSSPGVTLSIDSVSELGSLAAHDQHYRAVLRLRPDFASAACVDAGPASRFGVPFEDLGQCRAALATGGVEIAGFHIFAGSQVLDTTAVVRQLHGALDLALRAADMLQVNPQVINLGGGFGVPYAPGEHELDLAPIGDALSALVARATPARIVLELGRYLVAQAGWYLTRVVATQRRGARPAVVVDGGTHQRADLCGLGLPATARSPLVLTERAGPWTATDVWGCLCLPGDVLAEAAPLPSVTVGDVLAFPTAGAYGLSASPALFLSHPVPAEVAFHGSLMELLRPRPAAHELLTGQARPALLAVGADARLAPE
jgi:diaminopimelate decarboxylase